MSFSIVAELPLGVYRGQARDGRPERLPSITRLHAALLCAAGFGPRSVPTPTGDLGPCEADEVALRWLEEHPPDGVQIPALEVNRATGVAYRDDGTLRKSKVVLTVRKLGKPPSEGTAVGGVFVWSWSEPPPPDVRAAFESLCPDVGYLGTTESPVRLRTVEGPVDPTHMLDREAGFFGHGLTAIERPVAGRLAELSAAHRDSNGKPPSIAKDKYGTDEKSLSAVPPREAVASAYYRSRERTTDARAPWSQLVVLPLSAARGEARHRVRIDERQRVAWAVAAHRALIRIIGEGAPALVTGAYPDGAKRPNNRVALHILDDSMPLVERLPSACALAVLIPRDADPADVGVLYQAIGELSSVRGPGGQVLNVDRDHMGAAAGDEVWAPSGPGRHRLWQTVPPAVPDTRGPSEGGPQWGFGQAALLSVGFVLKAQVGPIQGRGAEYQRALASAVAQRGAVAVHVSALRSGRATDFVHRVNPHAVVRPYRAVLDLGELVGSGTAVAIGQSRHLGGGLLVPCDIPKDHLREGAR